MVLPVVLVGAGHIIGRVAVGGVGVEAVGALEPAAVQGPGTSILLNARHLVVEIDPICLSRFEPRKAPHAA